MKNLKALFVVALAVLVAAPAFAETQNVKVSGSIDSYAFYRTNYDLIDKNDASGVAVYDAEIPGQEHGGSIDQRSESDNYFRTNTQVEVAADLTDNVSTVINIVNQRDWNTHMEPSVDVDGETYTIGDAGYSVNNEFDVTLDLAYVQLKEIFYAPLTLTIGRQDLWFGRGFIIGSNVRAWDISNKTQADEYSVTTAFDAARATLDFNPWTIDLVYSKITENYTNPEDDIDLYIANINYKFAEYNAVAELYYVGEYDRSQLASDMGTKDNDTNTIGGRIQFDPISQITIGGELAYQFGNYHASLSGPSRDRSAWAADIFGTYRWDNAWKPEITLEYVYFSGEDNSDGEEGDFGGWNGLYRGKFWTAYADFREFVYETGDPADQSARTNEQFIQVKGALKPLDDLLLEASFTYIWNAEDITYAGVDRDSSIGWEIDLQTTYDYTEDVSFSLLNAFFVPGDFYSSPYDETAHETVGSVKVTF